MKKLRRRLILIFFFLVTFSSIATVIIFWMFRHNILFTPQALPILEAGFILKDTLVLICALATALMLIVVFSKRTADPIVELSKAATQIASGNFDVQVEERDRKDEVGELERQFNRMARELQANEYLRKDFISNVSHEFKTPLSVIGGYADLLTEDHIKDADRRLYAERIVEESRRLSKLTANILELSKLNREDVSLHMQSFSLDEQLRECILLLEPKWSRKNLALNPELSEASCSADKELLSEVWINLLDNAIKFSPERGELTVRLRRESESSLCVLIRDEGIGMSEETRSRMFEQFYQGDTSHRQEGSGLGLSIVAKILELHGAKLRVISQPGRGSSFYVTLPL